MAFDTKAAAEAGHSIDDQINHLAKLHNYDSAAAEAAGFTKEAQLQYLAGLDEPTQAAGPSMLNKVAEYLGISEEMPDAAIGTALGAVAGPAMGPAIGEGIDLAAEALAKRNVSPADLPTEGAPKGVRNWLKEETAGPYVGGKTKDEAFRQSQEYRGKAVNKPRGSNIKIRGGALGIGNQPEVIEPTLAQKAAANIVNAEKVNTPSFTRRMLGTGVMGGELGSMKEELEKGNYGRATLSGLGALGGAASQSKIKPIRAVGTGLSTIVPAIQMMLPESEDQSNINKKNGGRINGYAKGKLVEEGGAKIMEMLKNKMAPLYAKAEGVPPPLPRAAPKSDAEIRAFAERMAPQVRGDFVRAPGDTKSVAGKTRAQFEREKTLEHDIRDVFPLKQVTDYSDAAHQGKVKVGVAGDQTLTGKDVYSIAGNPLSEPSRQYGGALYPAAHPQGWASEKGAAQTMQNLADEVAEQYGTDVLGQYMKMGPEASNYSMHNADAIIKSINPAQIKQLDTLNAMIRQQFPDFAGIENQAAILEQSRKNPELRKYLDYLVNTKKHAETHGLPSGADMRHALSEPDLRDLEIGATGKSIMQMKPGAKITPSSELTTTTYSHDIPGDYVGGTKYARPHQLEFADSYAALQNKIANVQDMAKQVVAENPNLDPQAALAYAKKYGNQGFGGFRMSQPRQIMDQQYMDETGKYDDYMKQLLGFKEGGEVQHFQAGRKVLSSGLETLRDMIKAQDRTPIVPVPNRWFAQPEKFPHVQGMVNKTLENSQLPREAFHSGAFIDPRTGKVLDRNIYNDVGVLIDPETGRPMMSAGRESGIDILDPKTGSYTKSNLVRQSLFKPTGGDPMLGNMPFIATIEKGDMGHKYGLGTEYATPTEMYNTMTGANPTLRPRSRGDVFGMGDVVGQVQVGGRGIPHDVYEKLFVAPKGSDVPGVKLNKANGGKIAKEAIEAFKKKFTPGYFHASPSNKIKEFDPDMPSSAFGTSDDGRGKMANATFLTTDPRFANSFLPSGNAMGYKPGSTVYPVSANLGKHFDYETPEGRALIKQYLEQTMPAPSGEKGMQQWIRDRAATHGELKEGSWPAIENPVFQDFLRANQFDSFAAKEAGRKNVGIFDPKNIRGKFAKFNPEDAESADFMKAEGGPVGYAGGGRAGALEALAKFLEGSKIPQKLYHGTTKSEENGAKALSQLKQSKEGSLGAGIYMTPNPEFASQYAEQAGGYVMPLHANLKNPLILQSTMGVKGNGDPMMLALTQLGLTPEKAEKIIEKAYDTRGYIGKEVMSRAQKQGYDGIAQYKDGDLSEVVSFSPYGIKSATGNTGEFAPYDPMLSKKSGGSI
jgi:hypothetical protein